MSGINLMDTMETLATVDPTKEGDLTAMVIETEWNASILSELIHTPYLLRFISLKKGFLTEHAVEFGQQIQPLIGRIIAAYKQTDASVRTTEIKDCQPQIVRWLVQNKMELPTPEELNTTGVLAAQKVLDKVSEKGKVETNKTGRLYKHFKHFHQRFGSICKPNIREIEPDRLHWVD